MVTEYKINIEKSTAFLFLILKRKLKNKTPNGQQNIKYLKMNSRKDLIFFLFQLLLHINLCAHMYLQQKIDF